MQPDPTTTQADILPIDLPQVSDFTIDGTASAPPWQTVPWQDLAPVGSATSTYPTRAKLLWSPTGIYIAVDCVDQRLTCTMQEDNLNLYLEDVVEIFLQPQIDRQLYLEYELSPLNFELPLLVPNLHRRFHGWLPWHYHGPRRIHHAVSVRGGPQTPGATITGWIAEIFIPFELFKGISTLPTPGTTWHANIFRIDFDTGSPSQWALFPATGTDFHDFANFGPIRFTD